MLGRAADDEVRVADVNVAAPTAMAAPYEMATSLPISPSDLLRKRRSSLDRDAIEGYMLLHVKKPRRKLFAGVARPAFFVVADARKSVLEVFSNESRSECIYALSLVGARLGFEADDADVVLDKCFCVEARAWKKRNTLSLKTQSFVFFEENQLRMLCWVKCIHLAIKHSSNYAADRDLFRTSNVSDRAPSSDGNDDELQHSVNAGCAGDRSSDSAAEPSADASECSSHSGAGATLRKRLVIDPSASVTAPKEPKTPFNRLNAMLHGNNKQLKTPKSTSASDFSGGTTSHCSSNSNGNVSAVPSSSKAHKESKTVAAVACALLSPKMLSSSSTSLSSPSGSTKNPFYSSKTSGAKANGASISSRSYGLHAPFPFSSASESNMAARKRDDRTSGSTALVAPATSSPDAAHLDDFRSTRLREYAVPPKIPRHQSADTDDAALSDSDGNGAITASQTLDNKVMFLLARLLVLWVAFLGGALEASIFLPIAAAGVFAHVGRLQDEQFGWATLAMVSVFLASRFQGSIGGVVAIGVVLYLWCYAEFKNQRRRRRVRIANKLLQEERENFTHVDIPNWICHPDVDRVEWLNNVLVIGWPFMKLAIRNSLMGSLNPLLDSVRPAFVSSLSLVRVDLGDHTPHISGVKFVHANPLTEEVTLDVAVRVVADESLVAELRMVSNLGAAAVVSLRDLFLVGTLRVTLNPLCVDWPCFSALSLSFTDRPVFDFSLTAAKINISNVPFASEWLHTFLHDLLNDYFVWPRVVHIPLWDDSAPAVPAPAAAAAASGGAALS